MGTITAINESDNKPHRNNSDDCLCDEGSNNTIDGSHQMPIETLDEDLRF